ncbi:hypothetical protein HX889_46675 [Pseudomonas reactans]|nr:hypothetical protein [Pseudomonas reactans]
MEWEVKGKVSTKSDFVSILRVYASGGLKFIVWTISNLPIYKGNILTPVIDGYIANHNKAHFVSITKVVSYNAETWRQLIVTAQTSHKNEHDQGVTESKLTLY